MSLLDIDWCEESGVPRSQCVGCQSLTVGAPCAPSGADPGRLRDGANAVSAPAPSSCGRAGLGDDRPAGFPAVSRPVDLAVVRERRLDWARDAEMEACEA